MLDRAILPKLDVARNDRRDAHVGMRGAVDRDAWLIRDHGVLRALANHPTGRFAHWPIIPQGGRFATIKFG